MAKNSDRPARWLAFDAVIRNPRISPAAKGLYALLVTYAGTDGSCFPGQDRLAADMGLNNTRTIRRLLDELNSKGAVKKVRRGKRIPNVYELVTGHQCPITKEVTGQIVQGDRTNRAQVTGHQCPPNSSIEQLHEDLLNSKGADAPGDENSPVKKSPRKKKPGDTDPRVQLVLKAFFESFKEHIGAEPPQATFNWARDGKRVRDLPADWTAEMLQELVPLFFVSPGFVRRNYSFQAFVSALPQLMTGGDQRAPQAYASINQYVNEGRRRNARPPGPVSSDFSDYED